MRLSRLLQPGTRGSGRNGDSSGRLEPTFPQVVQHLPGSSPDSPAWGDSAAEQKRGLFWRPEYLPSPHLKTAPPFEWTGVACFLGESARCGDPGSAPLALVSPWSLGRLSPSSPETSIITAPHPTRTLHPPPPPPAPALAGASAALTLNKRSERLRAELSAGSARRRRYKL